MQTLIHQIQDLNFAAPLPETLVAGFQAVRGTPLPDIRGQVRRTLAETGLLQSIQPGQRVAIGCGSRGVSHIPETIGTLVTAVRAQGGDPYVFPAMGSHGGSTAAGQRETLTHLGVTPESVGAPVQSTMEVRVTVKMPDGPQLYQGLDSAAADHVVLVNRIKPHTSFSGPVESGLSKMSVIGLGKLTGAQAYHAGGMDVFVHGLAGAAQLQVQHTNLLGGLALVENAREETIAVQALTAAEFGGPREQALLQMARAHMPRIPVSPVDVLVVRQMGKDISGTGMDTNVIGRYAVPDVADDPHPHITTIAVLSLTPGTQGNANGLGLANVIAARLLETVNWHTTYTNALAAGVMGLRKVAMPAVLPHDRAVVAVALRCNRRPPAQARMLFIADTLSLDHVWLSPNLAADWAAQPGCSLGPEVPLSFAASGAMIRPWDLACDHGAASV